MNAKTIGSKHRYHLAKQIARETGVTLDEAKRIVADREAVAAGFRNESDRLAAIRRDVAKEAAL